MKKFCTALIVGCLIYSCTNKPQEKTEMQSIESNSQYQSVIQYFDSIISKFSNGNIHDFVKSVKFYPTIKSDYKSSGIACVNCWDSTNSAFIPDYIVSDSSLFKYGVSYRGKISGKEFNFNVDIFNLQSKKQKKSSIILNHLVNYISWGDYSDGVLGYNNSNVLIVVKGGNSIHFPFNNKIVYYIDSVSSYQKKYYKVLF